MQIKDVFPEIFTGVNLNIGNSKEESTREIYTLIKDSIQYTNIIEKKLVKKIVNVDIKDKYKMSDRDIIISLKKPYKVGTFRFIYHKEIIIPNNFAILRNINRDKYSYIFVANYLERIGINKYIQEHPERKNEDLSISEIAINYNISRNGVYDQLKRVENSLIDYEAKLKLAYKISKIESLDEKELTMDSILSIIKE